MQKSCKKEEKGKNKIEKFQSKRAIQTKLHFYQNTSFTIIQF